MKAFTDFDGQRTFVSVRAGDDTSLDALEIVGLGVARCRPEDAYSSTVGELIAMGRAIADFGQKVAAYAESKVVTKAEVERALEYIETAIIEELLEELVG